MQNASVVDKIVNIFENYRMSPTPIDEFETKGREVLKEKIYQHMGEKSPISFVMLGFPFKSTNNRDKVLGIIPDKGEELSIQRLGQLTNDIREVYSPGGVVNILSDGYVFNDLLEVHDNTVEQYKEICQDMGRGLNFNILDIKNFYSSIETGREKVMSQFGITDVELEQKILFNPDVNYLYRGMIRFMQEELAMKTFPSNNQHHMAAKKLAKQMMFRNEAWSNLVKQEFQGSIRLSMHQSVNSGDKYAFDLIKDARHSAWHSVIAMNGEQIETMHKKDAIAQGYSLIGNYFKK